MHPGVYLWGTRDRKAHSGGGSSPYVPLAYDPAFWLKADTGVYQDAAVQFTAADKSWLQIADASQTGLDPGTDDFLICFWLYLDSLTASEYVLSKYAGTNGYALYVSVAVPGGLNVAIADGTCLDKTSDAGVISTGKWHFIAISADRNGNLIISVGDAATAPAAKLTLDISARSGSINNAAPFVAGASFAGSLFTDGRMDSLMFFKAADLSPVASDIIAWAYNSGQGRLCSEITAAQKAAWGAVSGWELGEGTGSRMDSWGSNHLSQTFDEMVTNGTFTGNSTGWTEGAGWAYGTNNEAATAATGDLAQGTVAATAGKLYSTSFGAAVTTGTVRLNLGGVNGTTRDATGTHAQTIRATSTASLVIDPVDAFTGTIDNVSVKAAEILAAPGIARGRAMDSNFAVQLNGSSQYLSYTGTAFDPGVGDFSAGCSFYLDKLPATYGMLISGGSINVNKSEYTIGVKSDGGLYTDFNYEGGGAPIAGSSAAGLVTPGMWYTLAVNVDRDGNIVATLNGSSYTLLAIGAKAGNCAPNNTNIGVWCNTSLHFPGRIDNAFYANRLLTPAEIAYLHNTGQWRQWAEIAADQPSLASAMKGFWEFDNAASLGLDSTANANNLTPQGTPTQGYGVNYLEGMVSRWEDQSGNDADAAITTLAKRPAYLTSELNSHPVLRGDGVDDYLAVTAQTYTADFTVIAVVECASTASNFTILGEDGANDYIKLTDNTTVTVRIAGGSATAFTVPALGTTAHVLTVTRDASDDVRVYLDGTESVTSATELSGTFTVEQIMAHGSEYLAGDLAELVVYDAILADGARSQIERSFGLRYGITV